MSDLEIMQIMSDKDMDIRMSPHLVKADLKGQNGFITMGVDRKTIMDVFENQSNNYLFGLYIINKEQFIKIKEGDK